MRNSAITALHWQAPKWPKVAQTTIVDLSTGETEEENPDNGKGKDRTAAVTLGRKGGFKGGKARTAKMTPEERSEAARKAARNRWDTKEKS